MPQTRHKTGTYAFLHLCFLIYACSWICSKTAAGLPWASLPFFTAYGGMLLLLALYAVGWQFVLTRLPLSAAYSNKAVTILWGILLGHYLFGEPVSWQILAGAACIVAGIILMNFRPHER